MNVTEIFSSIDGEGLRTGELATFIRFAGCNMRCSYCDTTYSQKATDGDKCPIENIVSKVDEIGYKNITITGGEPLIQKDIDSLLKILCQKGYFINIETNGSCDITPYLIEKNILLTMDYKTSSSGFSHMMKLENLEKLRESDVLKFVIGADTDFDDVRQVLTNYKIKSYIYLSPVFGKIKPNELVEFLKQLHKEHINVDKTRVQVQLHKVIWDPSQRGV